jgi:hypothetical protein
MQQTFYKTIKGHKLEFNRLLYPISYHVFTKDIEIEVTAFSVMKDETGRWDIKQQRNLPGWLNEIRLDLHEVIMQNETSAVLSVID